MKTKKTSLVTGGAGFLGSHVAERALKMNQTVIVLDDLSGGFTSNVPRGCIFVKGSINNERLLDEIFKKYQFNYIYHLAAYAAEGLSHFIRKFNYENNLIGSVNLINRAVNYKIDHFVFTSSIAVYGSNQTPMTEDLTPRPEDPYGISKYAVELDLAAAHSLFGLNYSIFRPHNIYGERQNHSDPYRNVLGIFINNIMMGKPMTIFGDGKQTRAFTHIDDVAPFIVKAVDIKDAKNEVFNIGADSPYTVLELAYQVARTMGVKPRLAFLPKRHEVVHAFADHSKVRRVFNIKTTIDLETGVKRMVEWAKKIGPLKPQKFKGVEINKKIPPSWKKLIHSTTPNSEL